MPEVVLASAPLRADSLNKCRGWRGYVELGGVIDEGAIGERYRLLAERRVLDERGRRLWAAAEARSHGHGGSRR